MFWAAAYGELEKVQLLSSDTNRNINWQRGSNGCSVFYVACEKGQVGVVKHLLSLKGIDLNKPMSDGTTPFAVACQEGHKEVVSLLLADPRIDPNQADDEGYTPFFVACQHQNEDRHRSGSGRWELFRNQSIWR